MTSIPWPAITEEDIDEVDAKRWEDEEVRSALNNSKNGKEVGVDQVNADIISCDL